VGENRGDNVGRPVERVTIAEAASLLGCHPNTVRSRVKAGMYRAEKVHTENGPTWMIERDSLSNNAPTSASQQAVSGVSAAQQEAIQELAKAIVREAGISGEEGLLEMERASAELFRTLAFLNTGLLAGVAATVAFLPTPLHWLWVLVVSVSCTTIGILVDLLGLVTMATLIGQRHVEALWRRVHLEHFGQPPPEAPSHPDPSFGIEIAAFVFFAIALMAFLFFALLNLPPLLETTPGGHGGSINPRL
jgi:hypothetical protein